MTNPMLPDDEHNRFLERNVRPADWVNPRPRGRYNLLVIGGGTAGLVSAIGAAGLGARVALLERERMGGDCLNVGCVPSKALIRAARAAADVRAAGELGVRVTGDVQIDFAAVMERMRRLRASISPHDSAARFRDAGVDVYLGGGRFVGPDRVEVAGQTLEFHRAVIATGARAARPNIPGIEEAGYLTNETVFSLTELPRRLAVIGAGPIGCELAQSFARFGSKVTLLEFLPRILGREDPDAAAIVERSLLHDGVEILTGAETLAARGEAGGRALKLKTPKGERELSVDAILMGVGRLPNVEGLGLEEAGVAFSPRDGVTVDDRLRTTNPRIFAAGDICSRFKFTHAADAMARIAIQNAMFLGRARASALTIPWCTYTSPEVAHVGAYGHELSAANIPHDTYDQPLEKVDRAILDGQTEGFVRVHTAKGKGKILGATIVAEHAGEMISHLTLAMVTRAGLGKLARVIHPYPTQAEAIKRVADAYNRTRLTPRVKRLFETWLGWRRGGE